jgi:hypothetical protein
MRRTLLLTIALVCLLGTGTALASSRAVIRDCTDDGRLSRGYSQKDYRDALAHMPTDVEEYTDCREVIRRAQLGAGGPGGGGAGGGGVGGPGAGPGEPTSPSGPAELQALARAQAGGGAPIRIGERLVTPGAADFTASDVRNPLPAPLIVVLAMLGAAALAAAAVTTRNRVLARRRA